MASDLRDAIRDAARRPDVREAVDRVYHDLQAEIDQRRPRCVVSGRCCRFEEFGHRLYVTTIELARFAADLTQSRDPEWDGAGCPFQRNKLCTVHPIRPFGCRIFFCDASSTQWQREAYEQFHIRLKQLHDALGVPYAYLEWREALKLLETST